MAFAKMFQNFFENIIFKYFDLILALVTLEMILKRMLHQNLQPGALRLMRSLKWKFQCAARPFSIWPTTLLEIACLTLRPISTFNKICCRAKFAAAPRAKRAGLPLRGSGPDNVWQGPYNVWQRILYAKGMNCELTYFLFIFPYVSLQSKKAWGIV